ncbi:hypothetical protein [Antarctobacter heliothermus]|uniref:hypothetical protein n=1 Tax=Antarctobacter heliothermus TaxID=74033 RepID=UPI000B779B9D|nr:hypothetical protein [Antarctobacter heliothermus]
MLFAFYDLETSGISLAFDQPLQFSAILAEHLLLSQNPELRPGGRAAENLKTREHDHNLWSMPCHFP